MARRRYRKNNGIEGLFDLFFELTGYIWQVGAAVTVALLFLAYATYGWAEAWSAKGETSTMASAIVTQFSWAIYAVPFMFIALAVMFAIKTYRSYCNQQHF
jgi:TRAP-type C4-dicarboxylate transport system permease small subunit